MKLKHSKVFRALADAASMSKKNQAEDKKLNTHKPAESSHLRQQDKKEKFVAD